MPKHRVYEGGSAPDIHTYHFTNDEDVDVQVKIYAIPGDNYAVISLESDIYLDVYISLDHLRKIGEALISEAVRKG